MDVSGDAYVYRQCDAELGHVEIRDPGAVPSSRSVGSGGYGARISGRYVAWLGGAYSYTFGNTVDVVVYDRFVGQEVYRLPRADIPGTIHGLDVQDDGKVAIAYENGTTDLNPVVVGWASPQEPRLHRLPLPPRGEYGLRIAGDQIAYQAGVARNFTIQRADVGIVDLAGRTRLVPATPMLSCSVRTSTSTAAAWRGGSWVASSDNSSYVTSTPQG